MSDDIVARLRDCTCVPHGDICREAADEIERLRELSGDAGKLREERDEARRWFCFEARRVSDGKNSQARAREIAEMFFWDCFKEDTDGK